MQMQLGLCNGTVFVRLSVCRSSGWFAAVGPAAGDIDRLLRGRHPAAARRSAANASSVTLSAAVEG